MTDKKQAPENTQKPKETASEPKKPSGITYVLNQAEVPKKK